MCLCTLSHVVVVFVSKQRKHVLFQYPAAVEALNSLPVALLEVINTGMHTNFTTFPWWFPTVNAPLLWVDGGG